MHWETGKILQDENTTSTEIIQFSLRSYKICQTQMQFQREMFLHPKQKPNPIISTSEIMLFHKLT